MWGDQEIQNSPGELRLIPLLIFRGQVKKKKKTTSVILEQQYSHNGDLYDLIHTENNLKGLLSPLSKSHVGPH